MIVEEAMSRRVVTCRPTEGMHEAARKMWDEDLGWIVVADGAMKPLGIVTDRDLCMGMYTRGKALHELEVSACAQTQVQTCRADEELGEVVLRMGHSGLRRLPVVDAGERLLGVLSLGDAARAALRTEPARERGALCEAVATALALVTRPRGEEPVIEIAPSPRREPAPDSAKPASTKTAATPSPAAKPGSRRKRRS